MILPSFYFPNFLIYKSFI